MAAASSDSDAVAAAEADAMDAVEREVGETPVGYDDLVRGAAIYRDATRRVMRITGDRAPDMLKGLLTADIRNPGDGAAWPTLILTPKGRVLADAVVVRVEGDLLLDLPEAAWPGLEPHFGRYLPPRFAKLEPTELEVVRIRGPEALARSTELLPELASLSPARREEDEGVRWSVTRFGEGHAIRRDGPGGPGVDLLLPSGELGMPTSTPGSDLPTASTEAWDVWRVEQGIPLYGHDVSEDNLPQETGLVADTTSFSKGCYTGQEVLARIHYRGKVNRHLRGLRALEPSDAADPDSGAIPPLEAGDQLAGDERVVGAVTSAVRSPRFGPIGLGYVRREFEPGDIVVARRELPGTEAHELPLQVVELPFT